MTDTAVGHQALEVALGEGQYRPIDNTLSALQTGEIRWYATSMVFGMVLLLVVMLRNAS